MKLRNKKTGEIVEPFGITCVNGRTFVQFDDGKGTFKFEAHSLAELNEEWEDVPEESVKPYWFVNDLDGEPMKCDLKNCGKSNFIEWGRHRKEIGNYFETEKECQKAVERLRAWKRLKGYNVKFNLDFVKNKIDFTYTINNSLLGVLDGEEQIFNNMKIVFGDEE